MHVYLVSLSVLLSFPIAGQGAAATPPQTATKEPITWVRGTVRDTAGHPVAGAVVRVLGTFQGTIRRYQVVAEATTGPDGSYEVKGQPESPYFSGTVLATAPGHAPAWAWPEFSQFEGAGKASHNAADPPTQNLVLPSTAGHLRVLMLRDGKPAAGITVTAYLENANLRDMWARPLGDASAIENAAYPITTTNQDGAADFDLLLPGTYTVVATGQADMARNRLRGFPQLQGEMNEDTGIPVRAGETSSLRMDLWKQDNRAIMKPLKADGTPMSQNTAMSYGPVDTIQWNTTPQFDSAGLSNLSVTGPGLWRIDVMSRNEPIKSFPIQEPYFRASAVVAVSPSLGGLPPPTASARWVDAGSVLIHLRDLDRKPLRLKVQISNGFSQDKAVEQTDDHGDVVFKDLHNGEKYFIRLLSSPETDVQEVDLGKFLLHPAGSQAVPEETRPWLNRWTKGWDRAAEIRAQPAVMERTFIARSGKQTELTMSVVPMTYVYGIAKIPVGADPKGAAVVVDYPWQRRGAWNRYWDSEGHYIVGPFPPGEVTLKVQVNSIDIYHPKLVVTGRETKPIRFDFDPLQYPKAALLTSVDHQAADETVLGMGGISAHASGAHRLTGQVFESDSTTPALGAEVLFFPPGVGSPRLLALADAMGTLQPRGLWYSGSSVRQNDAPDTATLVAFLPGACGAVIQTSDSAPGAPLHIVLPPANEVTGTITIGGKFPQHRPGILHVFAEWQGKSFLRPYLSLETTADADGHFTMAGLTGGDYLVQASLDNLWLSQPVMLHVADDKLMHLQLAIPQPGAALHVKIRDAQGNNMPGANLVVERSGPLASLWPSTWSADGKGQVTIPTLEAGWHTMHIDGDPKMLRVRIPALPAPPVTLPVTLHRSGHHIASKSDPDTIYSPM